MTLRGGAGRLHPLLEDPAAIASADGHGMLSHVAGMGAQLRRGWEAGRSVERLPSADGVRSMLVCGMGGSGVAGDVVRCLFSARLTVPVVVSKGYSIPEFCGKDTFVLAISFSGDTEETLSAYDQALARGARIVTFSSGGRLADRSARDGVPHVLVPGDVPAPRAAVGYLASAPIAILDAVGLIPATEEDLLRAAALLDDLASRLGPDRRDEEGNEAKSLASWFGDRTPVVWGSEGITEAAALRWKTQMNENAKRPAFHSVLPELDHNELEGWSSGTGERFALAILRHEGEHRRIAARVDASLDSMSASGLETREVWAEGTSPFEQLFALVMVGDFTSTYLAVLRGVDPMGVPNIVGLKERLSDWQK